MPDPSTPNPRSAAAQTDAAALLTTLLASHPGLPALHWSLTTRGNRLIGTSLSDEPSLQRAETRAWARAVGVEMSEDQSSDTTYLWGQRLMRGVRLILHTMIIVRPDEDSERIMARILGDS